MKILFAVNNDNISEAIVKKYQQEYKEILSYKNVYYFNAILRELQKDKGYNRIVISEDLEPFANNNYDSIDKFLFEKYSSISEEAKDVNKDNIDIILICADRRKKTDNMISKIFKKNIYNAIIGQDRSIDEVCKLINTPRDKAEARTYYGIQQSELGDGDEENSVSEAEVENIRAHYARLGKNEDKYVESFNNIVVQYTDAQLKIIIKYLPMNVKAVLEERSPKYQQLVMIPNSKEFNAKKQTAKYKEQTKQKEEKKKEDDFVHQMMKQRKIKSVVIPTSISKRNNPKVDETIVDKEKQVIENEVENNIVPSSENNIEESTQNIVEQTIEEKPKRGRGRPRKNPVPVEEKESAPKRGRGRPRKNPVPEIIENVEENTIENKEEQDIDLFNIEPEVPEVVKPEINLSNVEIPEKEKEQEVDLFNIDDEEPEVDLFNMDDEEQETEAEPEVDLFNIDDEEQEAEAEPEVDLFNMDDEEPEVEEKPDVDLFNVDVEESEQEESIIEDFEEEVLDVEESNEVSEPDSQIVETANTHEEINTTLTADKKIVAFVGTTKNGTSFIVNNTAEMLASMGIETAILDMTKSKNAYYIYTNNEEDLRNVARECMEKLQNGIAEGIKVNRNLTVYTEMPGEEQEYEIETILNTLLNKYSAVLIDTDFDTPVEVFEKVQELYLVQTMDVLTIQPLTAFLRNLKSKNILKPEKLKIVVNKAEKIRSLSIKTLIGGMSCYNSPSMTYMTELFNKNNVPYCEIPFEVQNYVKYLDSLVNCSISLNGYTKQFMSSLRELANMVYPLVNKQKDNKKKKEKNVKENREPFSNEVNDTLNKMRNKY